MSPVPSFSYHLGITLSIWASFTLTVLSQCDLSKFCSQSNVCDVFQTHFHCFFVYNQTRTWREADVLCRSLGAQLAEIHDVTTFDLFKNINKYTWLNSKPNDLGQWTYLRNQQTVIVDSSTIDSWQTHCGVLVQESTLNQDGGRVNKIWLTTRRCNERMRFLCRKTTECSIMGDNCVTVENDEMSWHEARSYCTSTGGDLMWINAGESLDVINPILQSNGAAMYFVGFTKRIWKWLSTRSDVLFCKFWYQDPDDTVAPSVCLHTYPSGFWGDVSCDNYMHPVCMIEKTNKVTPTVEITSSTLQTTPTLTRRTTTPILYGDKTRSTTSSTTTTTGAKTPTGTQYPSTPSTTESTTFTSTAFTTTPVTSTTSLTFPLTSFSYERSDADINTHSDANPPSDRNTNMPTEATMTSAVEDNGSLDDVTIGGNESEEPAASRSTVLSYGVIAGVVVGITVSATCLVAAVAVVIHSRNKARRRLTQNLPTYSGDTCRSFVFDNVVDPAPAQSVKPNQNKQTNVPKSSKSIPLHYQNVSLTTNSTDSNRALTSREKFKERRKHTYMNLFNGNKWPSKQQCNC